jgi:signal transduction histidine kinase
MNESALFAGVRQAVAARVGDETYAVLEKLLQEIWAARDRPAEGPPTGTADALAQTLLGQGEQISSALGQVLDGGRTLIEEAQTGGAVSPEAVHRLHGLVDAAALKVVEALERARRQRRQAWLGFLAHEFKNPLNTVLNALWLLRERGSDTKQAARFIELGERAVRRLEARILDMRSLDEQLRVPPPGWEPRPAQPTG